MNLATGTGSGGYADGDTFNDIENVIGSNQSDTLIGNAAANRLSGGDETDFLYGGDGDDTLIGGQNPDRLNGGAGADAFRLSIDPWSGDTIEDFQSGEDRIELEASTFGLPVGALDANIFALDMPEDADDRLIFDTMFRTLYYDADGIGSGAAIQLARFYVDTLSASDIVIVPYGS